MRFHLVGGLGAAVVFALAGAALADTIILKDGRRFTGEVTQSGGDYVIKTRFGEVHVSESDFGQWVKDTGVTPGATTPGATTGTPGSTGGSTPAGPTKPAANKPDPKTLDALLKQGRDALAAGEYKAARDAFKDVVVLDPKNAEALHGLGLASMYLNDFFHAREPMEKALTASPSPSRALVSNMAVCQIGVRNPMRAAKIIMDYLTAHPQALDEPLCNAMGTALTLADDQAKKGRAFSDAVKFYMAYNTRLEAATPGLKRWGVEWLKGAEYDKKMAAQAKIQKTLDQLDDELDGIDAQVGDASKALDAQENLFRLGYVTDLEVQIATQEFDRLVRLQTVKDKHYEEVYATIQRPTFPKAMNLVAMDDLTPPPVANNAVVAENIAPPIIETIKVAPPKRPVAIKPKPATTPKPVTTPKPGTTAKPIDSTPVDLKPVEDPVISVAAQAKPTRKVRINTYAAAFPVTDTLVLTSAAAVAGSSEVLLQGSDGFPIEAALVRVDSVSGLALIRVIGKRLTPLPLSGAFAGGAVQCAGYPAVNIFNPMAEAIPGSTKPPAAADWKVSLSRHPRLGGAPLVVQGKVVGVELATRDIDAGVIPAATLEQIKKFLGEDLAKTSGGAGPDPCTAMLELMATRETQ